MQDSKKYGKDIDKLYRAMKKKHPKVKPVDFDDPAEALVYAVISEEIRSSAAKSIRKRIGENFIDLNELRVSRQEEICEVLGDDSPQAKRCAANLTAVLNAVFQKFDRVSLQELRETGKRQARKELESLGCASNFSVGYCFLAALGGHAIPLTPRMFEYLRAEGVVDPEATDEDIASFVERHIPASKAYEFYSLLRRQSEASSKKFKKSTEKESQVDTPEVREKKATRKTKVKKKEKTTKTRKKTKTKTKTKKKKTTRKTR